jgi:hypothetical protein
MLSSKSRTKLIQLLPFVVLAVRVSAALALWTSMVRTPLPVSAESTVMVARTPTSILYLIVSYSPSSSAYLLTFTVPPLVYIIKDLVPDMTLFYKQYKSIQPWLQNDTPPEKGMPHISLLSHSLSLNFCRRVPPITGRPSQARWHVRMYSLCLLFHFLPILLVEPGWISGPCDVDAGL